MSASTLNPFVGMTLQSASSSNETVTLTFDRGRLVGFNRHAFSSIPPLGEQVQVVRFKEREALMLVFSSGSHFELSLASEDYRGPEAFCATFEGGTIIVE